MNFSMEGKRNKFFETQFWNLNDFHPGNPHQQTAVNGFTAVRKSSATNWDINLGVPLTQTNLLAPALKSYGWNFLNTKFISTFVRSCQILKGIFLKSDYSV